MAFLDRVPVPLPPLPEMTTLPGLICRLHGTTTPSLALALDAGRSVLANPAALIWKDQPTTPQVDPSGAMLLRGPARFGLSLGLPGQIVPMPLRRGEAVQLRAGQFLLALDVERRAGQRGSLADRLGGGGPDLDHLRASDDDALVFVQAQGDVLERLLGEGEVLDLRPEAFLAKDETVAMEPVLGGDWPCLRLIGPGRVALQLAPAAGAESVATGEPASARPRVFGLDLKLGKRR